MDDAERQRTMDFILRQQAQFAVGMQRLEGQQAQFADQQSRFADQQSRLAEQQARLAGTHQRSVGRIDRLERVVLLMARQFRRERRDLRERMAALVDAQIRTEEAVRVLAITTERNSRDITALTPKVNDKTGGESNGGDTRS